MIEIEMPAGTYYVGDPCYVFSESWKILGEQTDWFQDNPVGELNGCKMLAFHTLYGDGCYVDQNHREYSVDAGLLGVVPKEMIECLYDEDEKLVTFDEPFLCVDCGDGFLIFGNIVIHTGFDDDEE